MNRQKTAEKIISNLKDRKGFDYWWDSIDFDIQDEIKDTIQKIIDSEYQSTESQRLQKELQNEDNDIKAWSLFFKVARAKRLETFENQYLKPLQDIIDIEKRINGSYTFDWNGGTYDFFPKKNSLLHRQSNTWKQNGIQWICKNILKNG